MAKYKVQLSQVVGVTIEVEAEDPETAVERAFDEAPASICAQCSGWGQSWDRDDAGEYELDDVEDESGAIVLSDNHIWQRKLVKPDGV